MSGDKIIVVATFVPNAGMEDSVEAVLRGMVGPTRSEDGNEQYDLCESNEQGQRRFHLLERYADAAALDAHRATDHYVSYRASILDLLDGGVQVAVMSAIDVA